MRLFIAIELPKSFKAEVSRIQKELKTLSCGGRFVPGDNFHITLHFIGESEDLAGAVAAMREAARGIRPFTLHLGKYASFEKGASRTSILEVKGELSELNALRESLESALADNGFSREMKRFSPHITLGRAVGHDALADAELKALSPNASMTVFGITLFESVRREGRMVYRALHKESF
ncbi:MAG TPA: RNA 2',3'-cyclic phosphodiesterase [Clostridia bacterium]|nr:MAG: 2'-5'-RNA ligase [Firmicutes bacterium ADurb.Bin248]HOG00596.1 RNA 2',3'-cyclic phosphodiesterase [Clostridia bacterium]HOS17715.1 RNA 2',3'-cyclic phosphodiesterase [Clostridia bacterium]HPK14616.1 RNA 2',3'-cyclic phosphodiesterase [Clostridia bacterium]